MFHFISNHKTIKTGFNRKFVVSSDSRSPFHQPAVLRLLFTYLPLCSRHNSKLLYTFTSQ